MPCHSENIYEKIWKWYPNYIENLENFYYDVQKIKLKDEDMIETLGVEIGLKVRELIRSVRPSSLVKNISDSQEV